ncbi:hypothetical protein L204_105843 [Cryptococcus depauperatus]
MTYKEVTYYKSSQGSPSEHPNCDSSLRIVILKPTCNFPSFDPVADQLIQKSGIQLVGTRNENINYFVPA